uniref:Uncharacterized protein n=1 Tax=Timema cristinae TaxID=61476 RepID=A0A7R9H208_TIMCR|nr:unnamed protein product [Timema cristinae]
MYPHLREDVTGCHYVDIRICVECEFGRDSNRDIHVTCKPDKLSLTTSLRAHRYTHLWMFVLVSCALVQGTPNHLLEVRAADGHHKLTLTNLNKGGAIVLRGTLGKGLGPSSSVCSSSEGVCLQWESATLKVSQEGDECQKVEWISPGADGNVTQFEDCFDIAEDHWFGGAERQQQVWPFEKYTFDENSWITKLDQYQAVAEPYWVTSRGVYIYVDDEVPLFVDVNNHEDNGVCLIARRSDPYLPNIPNLTLSYRLCTLDNAREAQLHAVNNYLRKPMGIPDERMLTHPVWSTWAKYKKNIDADLVREFADNIVEHGFNNSQLEIDEQWERCFGSLEFDETKFPDVKNLTDYLKSRGFRVTLWTPPFINVGCEPYYSHALEKGYFVRNPENVTTTTWWEGEAGLVDFTNWEAKYWWEDRVWDNLREGGFDSRKFDAGESSYAPQLPVLNASKADHPSIFSTRADWDSNPGIPFISSPVCSEGNASSGTRDVDWSLATVSSAITRLKGTRDVDWSLATVSSAITRLKGTRDADWSLATVSSAITRLKGTRDVDWYVETAARFGNQIEVRTARRTQSLNIFLRMLDKNSEWGFSNGLNTLVTTLLVFNMAGYPFVLPDMIGGIRIQRGPFKGTVHQMDPDQYLHASHAVRLSALGLRQRGREAKTRDTVEIAKKFTALHYQYSDLIIELARNSSEYGSPINPPIWWVDPDDSDAQAVDDEYLLGESILVAPVMEEGATSRDIYLPQGTWRDELHPDQDPIQGRIWLRDFPAALDELPYFTKIA